MLTQDQIDSVIAEVLAQEGGLEQDDPKDPSTRTNFGITQETADDYNLGDVGELTQAKAVEFYRQWFGEHKIDMIPDENTFGLVVDAMTKRIRRPGPSSGCSGGCWAWRRMGLSARRRSRP